METNKLQLPPLKIEVTLLGARRSKKTLEILIRIFIEIIASKDVTFNENLRMIQHNKTIM